MRISVLFTALLLTSALTWAQAPPPAPKPAATPAPKPVAAVAPAPASASADPVVLTVGMERITKTQFEEIFAQIVEQMPAERRTAAQTPQAKRQLAEQLAELKALAQEARREKIDQTPEAKTQLAMRSDQLIAGLLFQKIAKDAKPTDADLKAYYDEHKADYDTVTARHILIRTTGSAVPLKDGEKDLSDDEALAKAKDVRAKLVAGGDFAELAKTESDDAGSGANGGTLGDFTRGRMVPQFEEAAFALKVNEISEPVKTQFGYHIIQVTKHESKSLDAAKPEITEKIGPDMAQKGVDAIKSKTTITFDQAYFGK
ncbi:MAG: peptidylprolyl isomerase [Acidobacteriota bacterium]|nr:peptidylprolyl isomerase [Acidobacteriota bacterium]